MWLWANTHGTFELGFAYLGLHLLGRWVDGHRPWDGTRARARSIGARDRVRRGVREPVRASTWCTFPIDLLSRGDILSHVIEWQSPDFRQSWGIALALWIVVYVVAHWRVAATG